MLSAKMDTYDDRSIHSHDASGALNDRGRAYIRVWIENFEEGGLMTDEHIDLDIEEAFAAFRESSNGFNVGLVDFERVVRDWAVVDEGEPIPARLRDALGVEAFNPDEDGIADIEYLVADVLPRGGVHMLVSKPEALKTWVAYDIAAAVAKGLPWLAQHATRQGRVVILDFEIGQAEVKRRLKILGADSRVLFRSMPPFNLTDDRLWRELARVKPAFVVVDSLRGGRGGDVSELDSRFAEPLARASQFAEAHACTFLVVHHSTKAASVSDVESLFSGTGAIRSAVDNAFYLERVTGADQTRITPAKTRKGATRTEAFTLQLTNEHGLELVEGRRPKAKNADGHVSDADLVFAHVQANPGCGVGDIVEALEMRRAKVSVARAELERSGRIENRGNRQAASLYVVPDVVPAVGSGTTSGTMPETTAGTT